MLPPVLEVYTVWHPADGEGAAVAEEFIEHFHGTAFTGLIGGAVEVFFRSAGWRSSTDAPRPIPVTGTPPPNGVEAARYTVIVPLLGTELAKIVQQGEGAWHSYLEEIADAQSRQPYNVCVLPYRLDANATDGTELQNIFGKYQRIASNNDDPFNDLPKGRRCRDLAQAITQFVSGIPRLTAFISHTKRSSVTDWADVNALIALVRQVIADTHLQEFFDASDLQPGGDWDTALRDNASNSALLALRTDLYPSREWCQREMLLAKRNGMPVITLDAIGDGEERGCFIMDHVPRVPIRVKECTWNRSDVFRALNLLVNECLKRALWIRQHELAKDRPGLNVSWWAPHAPEPVTLADWLAKAKAESSLPAGNERLRILHPDPPLGPDEKAVLEQILAFGGLGGKLEVMTPRQLAARGG